MEDPKQPANDAEAKIKNFLGSGQAKRHRGGVKCQTCRLDNVEQINELARLFEAARASGQTDVPWRSFAIGCVCDDPDLKYPFKWRALVRHIRDCLGVDVDVTF